MGLDNLVLGGITFTDQEVPESIAFPVHQSVAIHELIGGKRVIQTLGTFYPTVSWSGILRYDTALSRSLALKRMEASAQPQKLTHLQDAYSVIVTQYLPTTRNRYKIEYQISVEIVSDISGQTTVTAPPSVDQQVGAANQNANTSLATMVSNDPVNTPIVQNSYTSMNAALDAAGPIAIANGSTAQAAGLSITAAVMAAQNYLSKVGSGNLTQRIATQQYLNNLLIISKNFANGQAPRTVTVTGGSFAQLAAKYYNDVGLAGALQSANGYASANLPSNVNSTITLPPYPPSAL